MNRTSTTLLLFAAFSLLFAASCSKEAEPTTVELLTAKTWLFDRYEFMIFVSGTPTQSVEYISGQEAGDIPPRITFNTDGTGKTALANGSLLDPFAWQLDGSTLNISSGEDGSEVSVMEVESISESQLNLVAEQQGYGSTYRGRYIFK